MKNLTLNNGKTIPVLGLGTWQAEGEKAVRAVEKAVLQNGYRHLDCASIYENEKEIGEALANIFSTGKAGRKDLFVTSKLWNTEHHPDNVEKACRQTLSDLQLEYLDLYLMHWGIAFVHGGGFEPMGSDGLAKTEPISIRETWEAMENLVKKGLVKSIGVANFTTMMIVDLLSYAKIKPVTNQIEVHPYNVQEELISFCQKKRICVTAYSPLGSSEKNVKRPLEDEVVLKSAEAHKKTPAQILIKWSLQKGLVAIPKSTNPIHIAENIEVFDFKLSPDEMNKLDGLNKNKRFVDPIEWWGIPYFE